MRRTSLLPHSVHKDSAADALLGADHPLVRLLQRRGVLLERSLVVISVLSASIVALVDGASAAPAFVAAAAIVQSALACHAAMLSCGMRDRAVDLIVEGRGDLPLHAVARERRRLLDRGHQQRLAGRLDSIRTAAQHCSPAPRARPIFSVRVIAAVAPDLTTIAAQLRGADTGLRGVAATERLLVDGTSSLYGPDENVLREELHRIRYLLEANDQQCAQPIPGGIALRVNDEKGAAHGHQR